MKYIPLTLVVLFAILDALPVPAEEGSRIRLTVLNAMERIRQDQEPYGRQEAKIQAARNEWESFQVVVCALDENVVITGAEISDLVCNDGAKIRKEQIELYREEYVRVRRSTPRADLPPGLYADPLVPFVDPITGEPIEPRRQIQERWGGPTTVRGYDMYAVPFEVFRGQNQPIWVDVHVPADAPAGIYEGSFRVRSRGRNDVVEVPVTLKVWDFTLPESPTHRTHFGNFRNLTRFFDIQADSPKFQEIEMRYCRAMARHRLCPPIPHRLLPDVQQDGSLKILPERHEELKSFLSEFHVNDFEIPRAPFVRLPVAATGVAYKQIAPEDRQKARTYYREYFAYLQQNGWHDRAYVYLWDEPNLPENYEQVLVLGELVHEAVPALKCVVVEQTYPHDASWPDIDPAVDIWCPLWAFIDRETIRQKIAKGDEVWSYTALVQRAPAYHPCFDQVRELDPPYWHIDRPLIVYRVPTWMNRQYGITGLLYWTTVTTVLDPWNNPAFAHPGHYNGGGYLFYPGVPCGIDGPIDSMRLKNLRDGMEDYEYFAILEKRLGADEVQGIVDQVAPNWWDYCREPATLLSVRQKLAEAIEAAETKANE